MMEHLLCPFFIRVEIRIRRIPLAHRELLEMGWVSTFIAKILPYFKYPRESSTNSSLEIQFERDTQYEVMIKIIVMCRKCASHRTTSLSLEYGRLDLVESLGLKKSPHLSYHSGSEPEPRKCIIVGHEIKIAFAIEGLSV